MRNKKTRYLNVRIFSIKMDEADSSELNIILKEVPLEVDPSVGVVKANGNESETKSVHEGKVLNGNDESTDSVSATVLKLLNTVEISDEPELTEDEDEVPPQPFTHPWITFKGDSLWDYPPAKNVYTFVIQAGEPELPDVNTDIQCHPPSKMNGWIRPLLLEDTEHSSAMSYTFEHFKFIIEEDFNVNTDDGRRVNMKGARFGPNDRSHRIITVFSNALDEDSYRSRVIQQNGRTVIIIGGEQDKERSILYFIVPEDVLPNEVKLNVTKDKFLDWKYVTFPMKIQAESWSSWLSNNCAIL